MSSVAAVRWSFYAFLVALPFGTRKLLFQFTPGFHEYETAFIYFNDIVLASFIIVTALFVWREKYGGKFQISNIKYQINQNAQNPNSYTIVPERSRRVTLALFVFLLFAAVSIISAPSRWLALYSFVRLMSAVGFAVAVAYVLRRGIVQLRHIFGILAASAVFQSLIAFAQFIKQGSVGLWFLGEPVLSATAPGIAKFTAEGGKILRAYGTFPHPNVLGAFLVVGLSALCYLYLRGSRGFVIAIRQPAEKQSYLIVRLLRRFTPRNDTIYTAGIFIILLGLVLTFSRSAWLIAIIVPTALLFYCFMRREFRLRSLFLLFTLFAIGYSLLVVFSPFIFPRAHISAAEPSVVQRLEYNRLGIDLIAEHPFGVGIGNQVLYSVRNGLYEKFGMNKAWQWEPIHNIYLLMMAEIGIVGGLSLILLFAALLISNIKFQMSKFGFSAAMLLSLMAFGLVDHFLWTLRPGQLMLWLAIGMLWGVRDELREKENSDV